MAPSNSFGLFHKQLYAIWALILFLPGTGRGVDDCGRFVPDGDPDRLRQCPFSFTALKQPGAQCEGHSLTPHSILVQSAYSERISVMAVKLGGQDFLIP